MSKPIIRKEHPDDYQERLHSELDAAQFGRTLVTTKTEELYSLLTTYSDGKAEEKLRILREWFWLSLPDHKLL